MRPLIFHIVDVFAEAKYAGNQLAVFRRTEGLSGDEMQSIARETNFSETTFVLSETERNGGYDVRIFTPGEEVPFAGHPTLGTAYVICREIIGEPAERVNLNLQVGQIPVTFDRSDDGEVLWMKQNAPDFGPTVDAVTVAGTLGLQASDIDSRFDAREVSTGLWFIIVPLKDLAALRRVKVARDKHFALINKTRAKGMLVFSPESHGGCSDLSVRVFVPHFGIEEDPATGSGNGCLASYLVKHRYFGGESIDVRVEQGCEIGRPSLIRLRAEERGGRIDVNVGGKVVAVAKGQWL
jgi:trans-2,3-dihydro-3-hydroxyanthranilate isomerase